MTVPGRARIPLRFALAYLSDQLHAIADPMPDCCHFGDPAKQNAAWRARQAAAWFTSGADGPLSLRRIAAVLGLDPSAVRAHILPLLEERVTPRCQEQPLRCAECGRVFRSGRTRRVYCSSACCRRRSQRMWYRRVRRPHVEHPAPLRGRYQTKNDNRRVGE